jgi:DNA-binding NarL/FixJ family response regulator
MSAEPTNTPLNTDTAPIAGMRVLLIEDMWIIAQSYRALLETLGVDVRGPTATVAAARHLIETEAIDAAIVDMNLRGEMADALLVTLKERGIPAVIVTGHDVDPKLANLVHLVLHKPIRAEDLLRGLRQLAAGQG